MQIQEKNCHYCQDPFIPKRADAIYCSPSCKQLSYLNRKNEAANGETQEADSEQLTGEVETEEAKSGQSLPEKRQQETNATETVKESVNIPVKPHHLRTYRPSVNIRKAVNNKPYFGTNNRTSVKKYLQKAPANTDTHQTENRQIPDIHSEQQIPNYAELKKRTHMEEKEEEWMIKKIDGDDMASRLKRWGYSYSGYVTQTNKQLKQWLKITIAFANQKETTVKELKELLASVKKYQQSYDYKYLPKDYPYLWNIEELKDKLQKIIIGFEMRGLISGVMRLTQKTQAEFTYILLDIDQD